VKTKLEQIIWDNRWSKHENRHVHAAGFSLVELLMSLALSLLILGVAVATFSGALGTRDRETSRTDAITSAEAALNIMSREIGNSGYGLTGNGIVAADSTSNQMHIRANINNTGANGTSTAQPGEDLTFYCETCNGSTTGSVVRYDANAGVNSGIINRVSNVSFTYWNYVYDPVADVTTATAGPAGPNTGRVTITLTVILADVRGQPTNQVETLTTDVTLRNSTFMLGLY